MSLRTPVALTAVLLLSAACSNDSAHQASAAADSPYTSRYRALPATATLLRGATVLTGTGERLENADVLLADGKIAAVGSQLKSPDAQQVDASGLWITPGIIDVHSHLGVYASPGVDAHSDGNEATAANTAEVWAEHSVWPQDPGFVRNGYEVSGRTVRSQDGLW